MDWKCLLQTLMTVDLKCGRGKKVFKRILDEIICEMNGGSVTEEDDCSRKIK